MNQTWENRKKPSLHPDFGPNTFFRRFYLHWKLGIVASFHCMHFQGKQTNQTWENDKKPSFRIDLVPQIFFSWILPLFEVRHCCKLSL